MNLQDKNECVDSYTWPKNDSNQELIQKTVISLVMVFMFHLFEVWK